MSEDQIPKPIVIIREVLNVFGQLAILGVVVAILWWPTEFQGAMRRAGIQSIAGFEFSSVETVDQKIETAGQIVTGTKFQLEQVLAKVPQSGQGPAIREEIQSAVRNLSEIQANVDSASASIKRAVAPRDAPDRAQVGWLYLGFQDEQKTRWIRGPISVDIPGGSAELREGMELSIRSDSYLRGESDQNQRTAGATVAVLRPGDRVTVVQVGPHSHWRAGGWHIWVRVRVLS